MVLVLGDDFEFVLATFHWCLLPTILSMIVPIPSFLPSFLAPSITSFLLMTFVSCHAGTFSVFPIPCPLLPLHLESTLLGVKDLLFMLSVSRGLRLWESQTSRIF